MLKVDHTKMIPEEILEICRAHLKEMKCDLLNRARQSFSFLSQTERTGDEIDLITAFREEESFLITQERLRGQLLEVESALARIEMGRYGVCEETDEPIEIERLLAIPWTRYSIEGAEIRDTLSRRFVHI
jgi:DnaK suppressor protein